MSGLVLKDLLVLRNQEKSYLMIIGVYAVLTFAGVFDYSITSTMMVVLTMMMPMATFSYDDLARWDKYAVSTPIGRRGVVKAKYMTVLVISGGAGLLCLLIDVIVVIVDKSAQMGLLLSTLGAGLGVGLLINAFTLPLMFKYGAEKSRGISTALMLTLFVIIFGAAALIGTEGVDVPNLVVMMVPWLMAAVILGGLGVSYTIAQKIYAQKEL